MAVTAEEFRQGMRRLVGGVCLITTAGESGNAPDETWSGMTATAVCSVSAAPPMILCCVNKSASSYATLCSNGRFGVNVLSVLDQRLADHFAGRRTAAEKFVEGLWHNVPGGSPLLESAMAAFDCTVAHVAEMGTHGVIFGVIQSIQVRAIDHKPLLYAHGGYGGFANMQAVSGAELLWIPEWLED